MCRWKTVHVSLEDCPCVVGRLSMCRWKTIHVSLEDHPCVVRRLSMCRWKTVHVSLEDRPCVVGRPSIHRPAQLHNTHWATQHPPGCCGEATNTIGLTENASQFSNITLLPLFACIRCSSICTIFRSDNTHYWVLPNM